MEPGDSFFALRNFAKGKINQWDLEETDSLITRVRVDRNNLGQSKVDLNFDDEEKFLKSLDLSDDDIWFVRVIDSPYTDYEFVDYYSVKDDYLNGYGIWYYLNEENTELLKNISKILLPKEFDLDDDKFKEELAEKLYEFFQREIDDILYDYQSERNSEMLNSARTVVERDMKDAMAEMGFELVPYEGIRATVADLISLYMQYNVPHVSLKKLIKTIFEEKNKSFSSLGGWYENTYEYSDDANFDRDSFDRSVNRNLESIYEKLTEEYDTPEGKAFLKMIETINKKFKINSWNDLPKNKKFKFRIDGFNKENYKIIVSLRKPSGEIKRINVTEDNLNRLLYQPELFDLEDI